MRINVATVPNPDIAMSMTLHTQHDVNTLNYLQENYNNFINRAKTLGNEFVDSVKSVYNYFQNSDIINQTKRILTSHNMMLSDDAVYSLTHETIYNPGLTMKNYMMANPVVYRLAEKNRCVAYNDEWYHSEPEISKPEWRDDYLYAIDGVGQWEDDELVITHYHGVDNPLSLRDRVMINESWDILEYLITEGYDPTDPDKGKL